MIGERIRERRQQLGLSLKELAEKTELTSGFLSQIERDLSEPSISSLRKIAEVLGVAVFYFLLDDKVKNPVVRHNERKKIRFSESHMTYELLCPDMDRQLEMFMAKLEPGAMTCSEPMTHPGEEVTYVMKGTMWIKIGEEEYTLEEGDTIYYFGTTPHQIINTGDDEMIFISTITPPQF
ncbi:helix-turn-helix domain-containing protein [Clostridium sp.]|uniref:helix-turn-helix domain-containing protein n=1 Tax=Clostridium sp. TaxID=1506 RepID=UPI00262CA91F|nr:XRE family transcriptional regulator [Clostridium sp.]